MANATPSRVGQIGGTGATDALFLKKWSGEVLKAFENTCIMRGKVRTRTITGGKSAQFPSIGTTGAFYHTPGAELTGNTILHDEKIITLDGMLVAPVFIPEIDEAMVHFDYRIGYSTAAGNALAQTWDRQLLSLAVKAARDTGTGGLGKGVPGQGDAQSVAIGATPTVQNQIDAFYAAAAAMDKKNVPKQGRWAVVGPDVYWGLVTNDKLLNKFYSDSSGSYTDGNLPKVAGFTIVESNNVTLNHTAGGNTANYPDTAGSKYLVDASATVAVCFQGDSMGTLILKDMSTRVDYDPRRLGTLLTSKYAVGHGVLQPMGIYEIKKG